MEKSLFFQYCTLVKYSLQRSSDSIHTSCTKAALCQTVIVSIKRTTQQILTANTKIKGNTNQLLYIPHKCIISSAPPLKMQPLSVFYSLSLPHTTQFKKRKPFKILILCVVSVCIPLPKVPDLAGGGRLDLSHSAGTAHGFGQLGHGLRHRLLPRR